MSDQADHSQGPVRPDALSVAKDERQAPSLEELRTLAAALELGIPDADLERLRPEVAALRRAAARLRSSIPFDAPFLLGHDDPR